MIPLPNSNVSVSHPIFTNPVEQQRARDHILHLDQRIKNKDDGEVRETLGTMQSLLDPGMISQFTFKHTPENQISEENFKPSNHLSPFALMVLKHTAVEYVYPEPSVPTSPDSVVPQYESVHVTSSQQPATKITSDTISGNQQAFTQNHEMDVSYSDKAPFNQSVSYSNELSQPVAQPSQVPTSQSSRQLDRKRKRLGDDDQLSDLKAAADANLQDLKELIWEITTAEDQYSSTEISGAAEELLTSIHGADGDILTLSTSTHSKLDMAIAQVIRSKRFDVLDVEVLVKLQQLSLGGITAADGIDARFNASWDESQAENWLADVRVLESAFRASRTILRIMSGGGEEKILYPEEILQKIISLVCKVIDNCVTRVVEAKSTGDTVDIFRIATENKKPLARLLQSSGKVLKLLLEVITKEELSERPINDVLFFAIRILFVENSASEKDSVLGVQRFETFRRTAMNITSKIYSRYEDQRDFILREILDSLQKLPTTKVHSRQFKLPDGGRLQLTSVLLLRLVSTSGSGGISVVKHRSTQLLQDVKTIKGSERDEAGDSEDSEVEASSKSDDDDVPLATGSISNISPLDQIKPLVKGLFNAGSLAAQKIINYLVSRASSCSKTGEQPHRHLLDMFVEDLITVFNQPEWPASEILLRILVIKMIELSENSSTVSARNMALETLGIMGTTILATISLAKQYCRALESDDSLLSEKLSNHLEATTGEGLTNWELASADGPYHVVLEHISVDNPDVQGFHLTQWMKLIFWGFNNTSQPTGPIEESQVAFVAKVSDSFGDGIWDPLIKGLSVSATQSKLAYQLILLNIGVCKAFTRILNVLVASVKSDQVTVRARGLKSVTQMIEKDPSMLDRMASQVNALISRCVGDNSSMVRDNALALLGRCTTYSSNLDGDMLRSILVYTRDAAPGIKKRAIKLLKDLFLRDFHGSDQSTKDYKAVVSEYLLQTIVDSEESVVELGRQSMEEIWLSPFEKPSQSNQTSVQDRVTLKMHMNLLTNTMNRGESTSILARKFLRFSMSGKCKSAEPNKRINKAFVAAGFDIMLDADPDAPSRVAILQTMTVFAQANPRLFTQQQLEHLFQPYIGTTIDATDVNMFRKVVIILRWVLPTLSSVQEAFLSQVQGVFIKNLQRLTKQILNEVAACLWTINNSIPNLGTLTNIQLSVLQKLHEVEATNFLINPAEANRAQRYMDLAGQFGHFCDFSPKLNDFKARLTWLRKSTVPGMVVAALRPYSSSKQPLAVRKSALENIGLICEAWPQHFNDQENVQLFQEILRDEHSDLQKIVLGCFRNFFATQDSQFGSEEEIEAREVLIDGKIGGSVIASEKDAAAALIAQGFVKDILTISLSSQDDDGLTATEVLASILRQGLVHPKDIGPALVALSTSQNPRIAQIALQQHETLHTQHESMFEREYVRAITEAYLYQKNVVNDTRGFVNSTFRAKLHPTYEIVKTSKSKIQTKFLANYLSKIDFDPTKLDISGSDLPLHLEYARFMLENLAFFDYGRLEDLMQVVYGCERIVSSTGAAVSDSINRDVLGMIIDPATGVPINLSVEEPSTALIPQMIEVSESRLRLLTTSAVILTLIWQVRTFLRRLYNVVTTQVNGQSVQKYTGRRRPPKDANKIPPKNASINGEKLIEGIDRVVSSLEFRESSIQTCKLFSELMAVDSEVKVPADDAEDGVDEAHGLETNGYGRKDTPTWHDREISMGTNDDGDNLSISGSARKRRGSSNGGNTPVKKKRGRPPKFSTE